MRSESHKFFCQLLDDILQEILAVSFKAPLLCTYKLTHYEDVPYSQQAAMKS